MVSHERMKGAEGGLVRLRQVVSKGRKEDKRRDSPKPIQFMHSEDGSLVRCKSLTVSLPACFDCPK
jgi:hypothetical protein